MEYLKSWLERPDNPTSYYELLDCPGFCTDRDRLLGAVRAATRFLHPYENHKISTIVRRARSLQLLCATAGHTFADDSKWLLYDDQLKKQLRDEYFAHSPDSDVRKWLLDKCGIDPHRVDEIALFIVASGNAGASSRPPAAAPNLTDNSTDPICDREPDAPSMARVVPPAIPASKSPRKPPPLPPRHSAMSSASRGDTGEPSETAVALSAVTMAVPVQLAIANDAVASTRPPATPAALPRDSTLSGSQPQTAIQQGERLPFAVLILPKQHQRRRVIWWLSGMFVAMAVVGIIVLLSLSQTPRKTSPRKQASPTSIRTRTQTVSKALRLRTSILCYTSALG